MKRVCIILLIFLMIFINLVSCTKNSLTPLINNDWTYSLPNEYEIWKVNSRNIVLGKKYNEYSISHVVESYIVEFCYNNRFVGVKRVDMPEAIENSLNTSNPEYYLIDTVQNIKYGPFDESGYAQKCKEIGAFNLSTWIKTYPRPDGAYFG